MNKFKKKRDTININGSPKETQKSKVSPRKMQKKDPKVNIRT